MNRNQNISSSFPGNETIRHQYDNHLRSASLELDESANVISYEEYHPFGTCSYRLGTNEAEVSLKRYRYVGKERDEETGLYYYGANYYAAWIARFVSCDPLPLARICNPCPTVGANLASLRCAERQVEVSSPYGLRLQSVPSTCVIGFKSLDKFRDMPF